MLTKARKETLSALLTLKGQEETVTFNVEYYNRKQSDVSTMLDDAKSTLADLILYIVKSWESEYELSLAGIKEMESDRPGMVMGIIQGFNDARRMQREKNSVTQ